ncbi:MAG: beta-ketoacyl-[acyl-carrier-protein] synthase family protein [Angustibacter sp.]
MPVDIDPIVVTGIGAVTPLGLDRASTWDALVAGTSGVGPITAFDAGDLPTRIAAEVRGFDGRDHFTVKRLRRMARFSQFAVVAAREALADAGLTVDEAIADRVAVVVNAAVAGFDTVEAATRELLATEPTLPPSHFVPSSLTNMPACEVAIDVGAHGPVNASALACASGAYAVLDARRLILSGEADVVICGGTDAGITPAMFGGLVSMGAMSQRNDDPAGASRPFSADRDGFVFGEGSVILVLESAAHARRRGATPYAVAAAGALTCDAFHMSAPSPGGAYATAAIRQALTRAGVRPGDVDYICAHGTSTKANDLTETLAIRAALGTAADRVAVSAPKSMLSHMIGAAGALGAMVCAMAVREHVVPPTIDLDRPDPECDLDHVPGAAREMPVRIALTNAFGFGGQNCVAIFTE